MKVQTAEFVLPAKRRLRFSLAPVAGGITGATARAKTYLPWSDTHPAEILPGMASLEAKGGIASRTSERLHGPLDPEAKPLSAAVRTEETASWLKPPPEAPRPLVPPASPAPSASTPKQAPRRAPKMSVAPKPHGGDGMEADAVPDAVEDWALSSTRDESDRASGDSQRRSQSQFDSKLNRSLPQTPDSPYVELPEGVLRAVQPIPWTGGGNTIGRSCCWFSCHDADEAWTSSSHHGFATDTVEAKSSQTQPPGFTYGPLVQPPIPCPESPRPLPPPL